MNRTKIILDASILFENYKLIYDSYYDSTKIIGLEGKYNLNRIVNGKVYNKNFNIKIIYKDTLIPLIYLPEEKHCCKFGHLYKDGCCCLGLNYEVLNIWNENKTAEYFFDKIVDAYLLNFIEFQLNGNYITGNRSHAGKGIREYYANILNIPMAKCPYILETIIDKINKNKIFNGHQECLCGSGKKSRQCHQNIFNNFICKLNSNQELLEAFKLDYKILEYEIIRSTR